MGLLLLRVAVGLMLVIHGASPLTESSDVPRATPAVGLTGALIGAALVVGVLTPAAGAAAAFFVVTTASASLWPPLDGPLLTLLLSIVSVAIVLLGPGAFSVDSYLFGRREIVIPRETRSPSRD